MHKCLYGDDLLLTGGNQAETDEFKRVMKSEFEMTDLGLLTYFLGMEFVSTSKGMFMHQKKYVADILKRFDMMNCKSVTTPIDAWIKLEKDGNESEIDTTLYKQIVGSLRYLCNTA